MPVFLPDTFAISLGVKLLNSNAFYKVTDVILSLISTLSFSFSDTCLLGEQYYRVDIMLSSGVH